MGEKEIPQIPLMNEGLGELRVSKTLFYFLYPQKIGFYYRYDCGRML